MSCSSVFGKYLIYVGVPVLVMLGLGCCAVDSGEEGGLCEVHHSWVQTKRLSNNRLDSSAYISNGATRIDRSLIYSCYMAVKYGIFLGAHVF